MKGTIRVRGARVRGLEERFVGRVLLLLQRRAHEVAALLLELYPDGLATGDVEWALRVLLGDEVPLDASAVQRLTRDCQRQYAASCTRERSELDLVYVSADAIYVKSGLEMSKIALIGGFAYGARVVRAVETGVRESMES